MLNTRFLLLLFCFVCLSCSKEESPKTGRENLSPGVVSITPASAVLNDTIQIKLKDATVSNFSSVDLNGEPATVLENMSSGDELYFLSREIRGTDTTFDVTVKIGFDTDSLFVKDAFELKRMEIDSLSSRIIFGDTDTLTVYGKNFPKGGPGSISIYGRSVSENGNVLFSKFDGNKIEKIYKDSLIMVLNRFSFISDESANVNLTTTLGGQFLEENEVLESDFVNLGNFDYSSFFAIQPSVVYTPEQRFFISNNNFEDKIFVNGLEAPRLFSAPKPENGFNRESGYKVPAGLSTGEYEITGTTKDGVPLKNIGIKTIMVSDISFCPESRNVAINGTFRVIVSPIGAINKFSCNNCPVTAALVDDLSGMRWPIEVDAFNDITYENDVTIFTLDVPDGIVPNAIYSISFETQNGYTYIADAQCASPKIFIE
ncbi:hypothetical protein [Maribacter sp. 2210JD10-5]|uniref:hypothetical protein n=1 Tax=Maribacter sp. 2210JD10-5 TaxID=3386272 RepID=UPI0039BCDE26